MKMSRFWSQTVRKITPYIPGEQPRDRKYIKLNTNENPYPPSPGVLKAIREATGDSLRLYPDPTCDELCSTIARYYEIKKEWVFVGNGSDELLAFSFMAFFDPGREILFPDITYSFYKVYADLFHIDYRLVSLKDDFSIPVENFFEDNGGIIFPNPNAPTGRFLPVEAVKEILEHNPDVAVIIDEAYIDFGGQSVVGLIDRYPNLLVIRTLSKSRALAGMRIGFAIGQEELIEGLNRIKNSFNSYTMDRLALAAASAAFKDEEYYRSCTEKIIATRQKTIERLQGIGLDVIPSWTNFVFARCPWYAGDRLFVELRNRGILVRHFNDERIRDYLRITIGTLEEMDALVHALEEII